VTFTPAFLIEGEGNRTAFVLPGILAHKRNWRLYARKLAAELPGWRFVLVDLRGHGESHGAPPPHTLEACVDDLEALPFDPEVIIGHSFGGKAALVHAARHGRRTFVLDSYPGRLDDVADSNQVVSALAAIEGVEPAGRSRREVVLALMSRGIDRGTAQWLTTSLRTTDAGLEWMFDLTVVRALIEDYWRTDLWHVLERPEVVHVRGGRSDRFDHPADAARLDALGGHVLADAGHWLHVDAADALRELLLAHWPR
jgi:pimeloyl-ACP methyl ester carboxylesterase